MKYFLIISIIIHLFFLKSLELLDSKKTSIFGQRVKVIEIGYIQEQTKNYKSQIAKDKKSLQKKVCKEEKININESVLPKDENKEKISEESKQVELQHSSNSKEESTSDESGGKESIEGTDCNLTGNAVSYNYEMSLWFKEIKNKIEKFKKYPNEAREKNIEGEVLLDIFISNDGYVSSINIFKSSGNKLLDEGAIKIVKSAQPFSPPKKINISKIIIRVPVKFSLK